MSAPPEHPTPAQAEEHFRNLLRDEGLAQPDAVEHDPEADELVFLWHEPKLAVVLELCEDEDVRMRGMPPAPV